MQDYPNVTFSNFLNHASSDACTAANNDKPGVGNGMSTSYGPGELVRLWYLLGRLPTSEAGERSTGEPHGSASPRPHPRRRELCARLGFHLAAGGDGGPQGC